MDFGNLERRGLGVETRVAFDCNIPFTMTIKGASGALTHTRMPNGQGPYGGALPYSLAVEMPVRYPSTQMVSRSFNSKQIQAGGVISSNGGIATDGMVLAVQLGIPSGEAGLLAGDYAETITISVTPIRVSVAAPAASVNRQSRHRCPVRTPLSPVRKFRPKFLQEGVLTGGSYL